MYRHTYKPLTLHSSNKVIVAAMAFAIGILNGCAATSPTKPPAETAEFVRDAESLIVVDCLLPGQVRRLGTRLTYLTPRRPVKVSANECEIRGGEYVAYDRASFSTSLKVWLPSAENGNAEAQTYVGEIFEKGLGVNADYEVAALWYMKAADQGFARAQINLGYLYESGLGVPKDLTAAMNWYRKASGISDGELEYVSSIEHSRRIQAKEELKDLRATVTALQSQLQQKQSEIDTQSNAVDNLRKEVEQQRNAAIAAAARADEALAIPGKLLKEIKDLEANLQTSKQEQTRLSERLRDQQLATQEARLKFAAANKELADKQSEQLRLQSELTSAKRKLGESGLAAAEKNRLQSEVEKLTTLIANQKSEIESLNKSQSSASAALQAQVSNALQNETAVKQELDKRNRQISALRNQLAEQQLQYQTNVTSLKAQLDSSELDLVTIQGSVTELQTERSRLQAELAKQAEKRDIATAEQKRLSERLAQSQVDIAVTAADRSRLIEELSISEQALFTSRQEQQRLQDKLLDLELSISLKSQQQNSNTQKLEQVIKEREQTLQSQQQQIAQLRKDVDQARDQLAVTAAPDAINALKVQLSQRENALQNALEEQKRLTAKLMDVQLANSLKDRENASRLAELEAKLIASEKLLADQRQEYEALESEITQVESKRVTTDADKIVEVVAAGPSIEIIEPPQRLTRGITRLPWQSRNDSTDIIGRVSPAEEILSLRVNGENVTLNNAGVFTYNHNRALGPTIRITAVTESGNREEANFEFILPDSTLSPPVTAQNRKSKPKLGALRGVDFGNYHALIIGNFSYDNLSDLETAENDARELDRVLRNKYGFQTRLILNADRLTLLKELDSLRQTLTRKDNLLIYYAGHGEIDQLSNRGYWLPVDATPSSNDRWVSNKLITDAIEAIKAKHVMVVADSCYSGTMTRTSVVRRDTQLSQELTVRWYKVLSQNRVRVVLSSGGVKPVYDRIGNSEHSLFAQALIEELESNNGVLEAYDLYTNVQQKVIAEAKANNVQQNPQYAPIKHAGHESGEFFFLPKQDSVAQSPALSNPTFYSPAFYTHDALTASLEEHFRSQIY